MHGYLRLLCSLAHSLEKSEEAMTEDPSEISFQIPITDDFAMPLALTTSDSEGSFAWNEIYTEASAPRCPWPAIGSAYERKESSFESISVLKGWIDECISSHTACLMPAQPLPTRVLDVSGDVVTLYICDGEIEPFAALSHCWGLAPVIQSHRSSLRDRQLGIPWDSLSKTFQDAVTTTRALGLHYLWIDSLCIIQDDPVDWAAESGNMASIYEGARIVIAAADTMDGDEGFLGPRLRRKLPKSVSAGFNSAGEEYNIRIRPGDDHRWYGDSLPPRSQITRDTSTLFTRGWAFQERLLATRYVQFRSQEIVWECQSSIWCECGTLSRPSQLRWDTSKPSFNMLLQAPDISSVFSLWSRVINAYAVKSLTNSDDILPALSGLAKRFQAHIDGKYLAGLWEKDLPLNLLWEAHAAKHPSYRAPTWSWACMDTSGSGSSLIAESTTKSKASRSTTVRATVLAVSCTTEGDPTGRVSAGSITISGKILNILTVSREDADGGDSPYDWSARLARPRKAPPPQSSANDPDQMDSLAEHEEVNTTEDSPLAGSDDSGTGLDVFGDEDSPAAPYEVMPANKLRRSFRPFIPVSCPTVQLCTVSASAHQTVHMDKSQHEKPEGTAHNPEVVHSSQPPTIRDALANFQATQVDSNITNTRFGDIIRNQREEILRRQKTQDEFRPHEFVFGFHADTIRSDLVGLTCLLLGEYDAEGAPRALVLKQVSGEGASAVYERVGLIDRIILGSSVRSSGWSFLFLHAPVESVTII